VDDFGLYPGVNEAVFQLADMGRVHAVGCMVGAPQWRSGGAVLRRRDPRGIDVGLHLDFTECSIQPAARRGLGAVIAGSYVGALDRRLVREEVGAQLDAFEAVMGRPPAFVDGHQHVHQLPVIRDELMSALDHRYGTAMPWLRSTRRALATAVSAGERFKAWFIEQVGAAALASMARQRGARQNAHLLGVYDFSGGAARYASLLASWLGGALDGDLLMCHPSRESDPRDALGAARLAEFQVLSGGAFAEMQAAAGLRLQPLKRS